MSFFLMLYLLEKIRSSEHFKKIKPMVGILLVETYLYLIITYIKLISVILHDYYFITIY